MFKKSSEQKENISLYGQIDERTRAIVNQGDAYTGRFMLFAILFDVILRGLKLLDPITASNWDLLMIVIIGGFISTAFQIKSKVIFTRPFSRSFIFVIALMGMSAVIALAITIFVIK